MPATHNALPDPINDSSASTIILLIMVVAPGCSGPSARSNGATHEQSHDTVWLCRNGRSAFGTDHREDGALRVETMGDPAAARNLHGPVDDLATGILHPCHRRLDRIDVEII